VSTGAASRFHLFRRDGRNLVFDCYAQTVLLVDELAFEALRLYEQTQGDHRAIYQYLHEQHADQAVREVLQEIEALRASGHLANADVMSIQPDVVNAHWMMSSVTLMVAQTCNLRCAYCYGNVGTYKAYPDLTTPETARRAVDLLVRNSGEADACNIVFFGGEPLLNLALVREVVVYCESLRRERGVNFVFGITTNGTLLSDEVLGFLRAHGFKIILSLDGPRDVHDAYRCFPDGKGSFSRVMEAARKIKRIGQPLWVRTTITHQSPPLDDLLAFFEREVGADSVQIGPMMDVGDKSPMSLTESDLGRLLVEKEKVAACVVANLGEDRPVIYNPLLQLMERLHHRRGAMSACDAGRGSFAIATNGDIYPCHRFVGLEAFVLGNVWDGLSSEKQIAFHRGFSAASEKCRSCWAYYQCAGDCARRRALSDGTFRPPDEPTCEYLCGSLELAIDTYAYLRKNRPDLVKQMTTTVPRSC